MMTVSVLEIMGFQAFFLKNAISAFVPNDPTFHNFNTSETPIDVR